MELRVTIKSLSTAEWSHLTRAPLTFNGWLPCWNRGVDSDLCLGREAYSVTEIAAAVKGEGVVREGKPVSNSSTSAKHYGNVEVILKTTIFIHR